MDRNPLLPTTNPSLRRKSPLSSNPPSILFPLPEEDELSPPFTPSPSPSSQFKDRLIFGPAAAGLSSDPFVPLYHPFPPPQSRPAEFPSTSSDGDGDDDDDDQPWLFVDPSSRPNAKTNLHRSRTAPAMSSLTEVLLGTGGRSGNSPLPPVRRTVARQALIYLLLYLVFGSCVYVFGRKGGHFSSDETHPIVDAFYFSVVTMCTIGYGDITPHTAFAKVFSIAFVLVGFGFIDILLTGMLSYFLDLQENLLLSAAKARTSKNPHQDARSFLVDVDKGRMRIRLKVGLALGVVVLSVGVGMAVMHFVEHMAWLDSFYLSVMSVTTVGYGDQAFKSMAGRLFASFWLLFSTIAVARAFLYLAEARIDKRQRMMAKWVLARDMTISEFLEADTDKKGFVSKSEFVVYKLKEMGKISEMDIMQISNQFHKLDTGNCGKITLSDLMESHHKFSSS